MNINELEKDIQEHHKKFGEASEDLSELMQPLHLLHQKLLSGVCKLQEENYRLSNSEADVLITIYVSGDDESVITPTKLHQKLLFTTGAITKVLKKLEQKELIERIDDINDKRSKKVRLTKKGKETAINIFNDISVFQKNAFSTLTKKEYESFQKILFKILKEL